MLSPRMRPHSVSSDNNEMEGFVVKRGGRVKSWKRRWLTLKYGVLRYFKDQEFETQNKPIKSLFLGAASSCGVCAPEELPTKCPSQHCFKLYYQPHKRTYFFCTNLSEEAHLWVSLIYRHLQGDSPKNEKEYSKRMAKAFGKGPSTYAGGDARSDFSRLYSSNTSPTMGSGGFPFKHDASLLKPKEGQEESATDPENWDSLFANHRIHFSVLPSKALSFTSIEAKEPPGEVVLGSL